MRGKLGYCTACQENELFSRREVYLFGDIYYRQIYFFNHTVKNGRMFQINRS